MSAMSSAWAQLRKPLSTVDVGQWSVIDPFPDSGFSQNGAMQMHQHPVHNDIFYVCTFKGTIIEVRLGDDGVQERTIVDMRDGDLKWAFGCALHPEFRGDGTGDERIFLHYTSESGQSSTPNYLRVSQIRIPAQALATSGNERILIESEVPHREHVGGGLDFDNQGFLLVSIGDGGWNADSRQVSQKIDEELFSGIFRIDIDQRGGAISHPPKRKPAGNSRTAGYYIPSDNPFVGEPGVLEEFWALGFRNPWRISYDSERLALWIGEVGQATFEQIELARAGSNHEWSFKEGSSVYAGSYLGGEAPAEPIGRLTSPLYEFAHSDQNYAVVGGFVYRGNKFPELHGKYIFGDNQSSRVWAIDPENPQPELLLRLPSGRKRMALTSISGDRDGNIYFTSFASINHANVLQLARSTPANMPGRLSQTGVFTDLVSLQPTEGFVEYNINAPLWSDGMRKRRWLHLPDREKIDNSQHENWRFPAGSVFVKHFAEPSAGGRALETRVLTVKTDGHVYGATYVWSETGDEAFLQTERRELSATDRAGEPFQYQVPSARDCAVCHTYEYPVLGVNGLQLSGSRSPSTADPIAAWSQRDLLLNPVSDAEAASLPALAALDDASASLEYRVRSFLHSNCSFCHYPTGMQRAVFDARITTPLNDARIIGERGQTHALEIDGRNADFIVAPGEPENSAIYRRLRTIEREWSMPYLGRTVVHEQALAAVGNWIAGMAGSTVDPEPATGCNYAHAESNEGWGWNAATGESCPPLDVVEQNVDDGESGVVGCDYSHADANHGWGWNPVTRQPCEPVDSHSATATDYCDYEHADQNSGWGWNAARREPCPPE
jgi:glucose/arabinose dehydrogenase/mono/diheme cytochrome c family protein